MKILALDSSSKNISVAICEDDLVICEASLNIGVTHSKTLFPIIDSLLHFSSISVKDLDLIAVSNGPGSFTGLRIGISAVKGLAQPFNIPCVGVSTLEGLSLNLSHFDGIVVPAMDARRNQVYNALFDSRGDSIVRMCEDRAISIDELKEELLEFKSKKIILVGDGAFLCYNECKDLKNVILAHSHNRLQRASSVAICGLKHYNNGEFLNSCALVPNYIRLSQAQRIRLENNSKEI